VDVGALRIGIDSQRVKIGSLRVGGGNKRRDCSVLDRSVEGDIEMELGYLKAKDIYYPQVIKQMKAKRNSFLQPIFEAFTNAIEALEDMREITGKKLQDSSITISVFSSTELFKQDPPIPYFQKLVIEDDGIGFNDEQFARLQMLRDSRKGHSNKGTGRMQYLFFFDETSVSSIYSDSKSKTGYKQRNFTLSKKWAQHENAIIRLDKEDEVNADKTSTILTFTGEIDISDKRTANPYYTQLTAEFIKQEISKHYLPLFCSIREDFPKITINTVVDMNVTSTLTITAGEIPKPDQSDKIEVPYSTLINGKIISTENKETFNLNAFCLDAVDLPENSINLVSKDEIISDVKVKFDGMLPTDSIDGNHFLFLISGAYIDKKDTDTRGQINIYNSVEFIKKNNGELPLDDDILIDDIEVATNKKILALYPEIAAKRKEKDRDITELSRMFLLNPDTLRGMTFSIDESDDSILYKVYQKDAKLVAQKDAAIRRHLQDIKTLTPSREKVYQDDLKQKVNDLVKDIPQQNRTALTQSVARRRLVLELFDLILNKKIDSLKGDGRIDEELLHNLIFQQNSNEPENSDLWLINEEFIYFQGCSDKQLCKVEIGGEKLFREEFEQEEERYLKSLGENRITKKPDILLFPDEGKCIIIEFKAPVENVSYHLTQIDRYASLILNFTEEKFNIKTFYGYLIGESIEPRDVIGTSSSFMYAEHFDYFYRPSINITKFDGNGKIDNSGTGSLYTEIIKYSTLRDRAKLRNKIFIKKLGMETTHAHP
jgi:hypothetical protein